MPFRSSHMLVAVLILLAGLALASIYGGLTGGVWILLAAAVLAVVAVAVADPGPLHGIDGSQAKGRSGDVPPLYHHPDFATWAERETVPLMIAAQDRVAFANGIAMQLLGQHIVGADVRTALRHPQAIAAYAAADGVETAQRVSLADFPRAGQRWVMQVVALSAGQRLITLHDQSAIDASERMRTDFVANASHELRTPLAAIIGYVETLDDLHGQDDTATRQRFLGIIDREARRMQQLVADLLSISRIEADRFRRPTARVDLVGIVRSTLADIRASQPERAAHVVGELPDEAIEVAGDAGQLGQMVHNLVSNALKYGAQDQAVTVMVQRDGNAATLAVRDRGDGIAAEHLPRLTERFYRIDDARSRSVGGTGLGLAIVKHVVERHQGRLDIRSAAGDGTQVTVRLPLA